MRPNCDHYFTAGRKDNVNKQTKRNRNRTTTITKQKQIKKLDKENKKIMSAHETTPELANLCSISR